MIAAAVRKDVTLLLRDRGALATLFLLPMIFIVAFGSTLPPTPHSPLSSFQLAVPGNAVLFAYFISVTLALACTAERRNGTWRRHLAAPVPRWKLLVALVVPYFVVGVLQLALLFGLGVLGFGMHVAGSFGALAAVSILVTYSAVGLGILLAAIASSEKQLGALGAVTVLVMGMLGGCMVPRAVMPAFMQNLGLAVPQAWALDAYYAVLVHEGTSIGDVADSLVALAVFGTAFVLVGIRRFRFG